MEEGTSFSRNNSSGFVPPSRSNSLLPCLVCGIDLNPEVDVDSVVKQEVVDCDDNFILQDSQSQATFTNFNDTENRSFEKDDQEGGVRVVMDGDVIFQWFLKWFKVDFEGQKKKKGKSSSYDDDPLPFCGKCNKRLSYMLELQLKLDELDKQIKNGIRKFKAKIESSEEEFENKRIYERDPRYKRVRSKIIKSSGSSGGRLSLKLQPVHSEAQRNTDGGRKSSRAKRPISRFTSGYENSYSEHDDLPVVMVSPIDRAIAEEHLLKIEDDDEPANSSDRVEATAPAPHKNIKKRRISNQNSKSIQAPNKTFKKAKRPPPKNIKAPRVSKLVKLKKTPPATKIKEENDDDWPPDSPVQDLDEFNNDSNDEYKEDLKSHPAPARKKIKKTHNTHRPNEDVNTSKDPPAPENFDNDIDNPEDISNRIYRRFSEDPQNKSLSYGEFTFKLLDPQRDGEETQLQCITCSLVMPNKKGWVRSHVTKVHTNRFTCPQCPARFSKITNMRHHVECVHQGKRAPQKKYTCEICGGSFTQKGLKVHKWTHKSKEEKEQALANNSPDVPEQYRVKLQCDECGQGFNAKCNLQKHIERHHSGQVRKLELCPECGGSYKELQAHLKYSHAKTEPERTWECTEKGCGKKFRKWSHLTRHKNLAHLKLKPWKCTLCPRTFGTEGVLKKHIDSHLGIRPFKCDSCPSAFITRSAVNTHKRIFHEEGSKPRRKSYVRGPTMLEVGVTQEELRKKKMYYPPSLIRGAAAAGSRMQGMSSQDNLDEGDGDQQDSGFL